MSKWKIIFGIKSAIPVLASVLLAIGIIGLAYFLVQALEYLTMERIGSSFGDFTRAYNESVEK